MDPERTIPPAATPVWQPVARGVLAAVVIGFGVWVLHEFIAALAWAGVLAIALGPLYRRLLGVLPAGGERMAGPIVATAIVALVVIAPLVLLGVAVVRESHVVVHFVAEARQHGVAVPGWVEQLPMAGPTLARWWRDNLADPTAAEELIGRIDLHMLTDSLREHGREIVHRVTLLLFTLLTLFFVFRDGPEIAEKLRALSDRVIGVRGELIARHMIAAVHGTVSGLVLVGLAEGILLGIVYFAVGLPYPASIGAITGVAAVIPFAAPVVYSLAGLYLLAVGNTVGGVVVLVFGSVLLFIADHFIRPFLIGGAARLPFLLVLFGILGGLETMGFLGLFLGPAVMAAMVALWREWTEPEPAAVGGSPALPEDRGRAE